MNSYGRNVFKKVTVYTYTLTFDHPSLLNTTFVSNLKIFGRVPLTCHGHKKGTHRGLPEKFLLCLHLLPARRHKNCLYLSESTIQLCVYAYTRSHTVF